METPASSTIKDPKPDPKTPPPENRKRTRSEKNANEDESEDDIEEIPFLIKWTKDKRGVQKEEDRRHERNLPKLNAVVTFSSASFGNNNSSRQTSNFSLCLMGRAELRCLQGAVDILGYRLDPSRQGAMQVESPPWSSLLVLKPVHSPKRATSVQNGNHNDLDVVLKVDSWWPSSVDETHKEATFELAKSPFPGVRPTCIPPTWKHAMDTLLPLACSTTPGKPDDSRKLSTIHKSSTVTENCTEFRMAICGAKGVGKSTFLRYALNRILTEAATGPATINANDDKQVEHKLRHQVAILDADVGQPEMSPPGLLTLTVVSEPLLTPPHYRSMAEFPHDKQFSYFFGSVTSRNDPHRYMEIIHRLVHDYEEHFMPLGIPLLVNLDGWVKGLGYELLCNLLKEIIRPTNVIQIVGLTKSKQFELRGVFNSGISTSCVQVQVIYAYNSALNNNIVQPASSKEGSHLDSQNGVSQALDCSNGHTGNGRFRTDGESSFLSAMALKVPVSCTMPAAALRALRLCTYFLNDVSIWYHLGFGHEGIGDDTCEIAHRLAGSLPYAVPFEAVDIEWAGSDHFQDISNDSSPHNFDLRLDAVNAKLVGLCCRPEATGAGGGDKTGCTTEKPLRCVGLGLVRSIDRTREVFYVLTPVASDLLQDVNVLIGCTMDLPVEFWFRGAHAEAFPYQAFGTTTSTNVGAEPMKSRNNIGRKSLTGS